MKATLEIGGMVNKQQGNRLMSLLKRAGNPIRQDFEPGFTIYGNFDPVKEEDFNAILDYCDTNHIEYNAWYSDEDDNCLVQCRKGEGAKHYATDSDGEVLIPMSSIKSILDHADGTKEDLVERLKIALEPLYIRDLQPFSVDDSDNE